jgi:DNA-binding NarL/FixJ family response regulator
VTEVLRVLVQSRFAAVLAGIESTLAVRAVDARPRPDLVRVVRVGDLGRPGHETKPDILVLHGLDQREVTGWPRHSRSAVVLAVGDDCPGAEVLGALRAGVLGVVSIDSDLLSLAEACRGIAAGSAYLSPSAARALGAHLSGEDESRDAAALSLTARETQALRHLAGGRSQADISGLMNITVRTVKHHLGNVYRKLGVHNQHEAVVLAYREGLVV